MYKPTLHSGTRSAAQEIFKLLRVEKQIWIPLLSIAIIRSPAPQSCSCSGICGCLTGKIILGSVNTNEFTFRVSSNGSGRWETEKYECKRQKTQRCNVMYIFPKQALLIWRNDSKRIVKVDAESCTSRGAKVFTLFEVETNKTKFHFKVIACASGVVS